MWVFLGGGCFYIVLYKACSGENSLTNSMHLCIPRTSENTFLNKTLQLLLKIFACAFIVILGRIVFSENKIKP